MDWNAFVSLITLLFSIVVLGLIIYNKYLNQNKLNTIVYIVSIFYIILIFANEIIILHT